MVIVIITMTSRYQIQGEINQGGVGVVLKAWDTRLQRAVAIKRFLPPDHRSDGGAIDPDLMREAMVLSAMQHPNIVSIYDVLPDDPAGPCVVMEYLNGKDLEQAVTEAAMTLEDFYKVADQTLDALSNAHRLNLLHRDIKPANIQVTWLANGTFICKFVDFGLARFFETPSKQTVRPDGTVMGSVYYMAPEQLERRALDGRSDLYSLGCVFYYLLSMHRPFEGETVQQVMNAHLTGTCRPIQSYRPQLPAALCDWVQWLMERQVDRRPVDAAEALAQLSRIRLGQAVTLPNAAKPRICPQSDPSPKSAKFAVVAKKGRSVRHPGKPAARPRPLRWVLPALSTAALLALSALVWQRWQDTTAPVTGRTAASVIAGAHEAASKVNATAAGTSPSTTPGKAASPVAIRR